MLLLARHCRSAAAPPQAARGGGGKPSSSSSSSPPPPAPSAADAKSARRAARAVPIRVVHVSKPGAASAGLELASEEWLEKLRRHAPGSEVVAVRPTQGGSADADAERVLRHISPGDHVVLLDERGRSLTSPELARLLARAGDEGFPRLVFLVGGAYGHGVAARARADESVRLSDLTLNHAVARVVLLEALYRGWAILRGDPYHHA